jgi:hypothetical protein
MNLKKQSKTIYYKYETTEGTTNNELATNDNMELDAFVHE